MNEELNRRVQDLSAVYDFEDRTAVEEFVLVHPDLLPYLEQCPAEVEKCFPNADLTLVVELDEDEDNPGASGEKLFVLISVDEATHSDAFARLDKLDENWAIDVCESTNELLVIDLKY